MPLSALRHVEDPLAADSYIGLLDPSQLRDHAYVNQQLAHLLCRQVVMRLLTHSGDAMIQAISHNTQQPAADMSSMSSSSNSDPSNRVELLDLMRIVAAERVSMLQLMPSVAASAGAAASVSRSSAVVASVASCVPPILASLFCRSLVASPSLMSDFYLATSRAMMSYTSALDTDQEADRQMVSEAAGPGEERQLRAGPDGCGLLITFSSQTRLLKRDDRVTFSESIDGAAAPSSALNFTAAPAKSMVLALHGGDKAAQPTPLTPFFYPLPTNPRATLTVQLTKDRATAVRTTQRNAHCSPQHL